MRLPNRPGTVVSATQWSASATRLSPKWPSPPSLMRRHLLGHFSAGTPSDQIADAIIAWHKEWQREHHYHELVVYVREPSEQTINLGLFAVVATLSANQWRIW